MTEPSDLQVIACNVTEPTKVAVTGALAYVLRLNPGGDNDHIVVLIRSRGRRWVEKWENMRRLGNFRLKTIPPEHPLYAQLRDRRYAWTDTDLDRLKASHARHAHPAPDVT